MTENLDARNTKFGSRLLSRREALGIIAAYVHRVSLELELNGETYPSAVLDLSSWKLTLPIGAAKKPTEIKQPVLATYTDQWFSTIAIEAGNGVRFRAPVTGVTTANSAYPRSELREMTSDGRGNASWSSTGGTHSLFIDQAITALPQTKPELVAGQIHDAKDDVLVIRLEGSNLYINVDGKNVHLLNPNYILGERFTLQFAVSSGQTQVHYNGSAKPQFSFAKDYSGAYFKAGAYTQSNCTRERVCSEENLGEVLIYQLVVTHNY
jgi:hypothetical protein